MKNYNMMDCRIVRMLTLACVCAMTLGGCVREDVETRSARKLTVVARVVDTAGKDISSSGVVGAISLYLFDDETGFVKAFPAGSVSGTYNIAEGGDNITLVAWGNLKADSLRIPDMYQGCRLENAYVNLRVSGSSYMSSPDLFHGKLSIDKSSPASRADQTYKIVLERKTASISIRVVNAREKFGEDSRPFYIKVGKTGTMMNFHGICSGSGASYIPAVVTADGGNNISVAKMRVFPSVDEQPVNVELYRGITCLESVDRDDYGNLIFARAGQHADISIVYEGPDDEDPSVTVKITTEAWDDVEQEVEIS